MFNSVRVRLATLFLFVAAIAANAQTPAAETGTIQGSVKRAGASEAIPQAQIRLEGGPADPRAVQELIRAMGGRGIPFTPKKLGTVEEVLQVAIDGAAVQGVGTGFPSMNE